MNRWKTIGLAAVLCESVLLTGCGEEQPWQTAGVSESFYYVVEDFSQKYLELDQDGTQWDQGLDTVEAYLAGEKDQQEALSDLQETADYFETALTSWETVTLDEELKERLRDIEISPAEYEMFSNERGVVLQQKQMDVSILAYTLQYAEEDEPSRQDLVSLLARERTIQDSERGSYFYGNFNYWFPEADDAELNYLQTKITDRLDAYLPENVVWHTTQEEAEAEAMRYMDIQEEQLDQLAERVGQSQKEVYEMEQALEALTESQAQNQMEE